ncbi:MAG: hypothetical protein IPM21_00945 [Acidobacteria bacterium]|nr:hypothetical protein [Acidobacteriota bacterium]
MRDHTVEIVDKAGVTLRLRVSTPSAGTRLWGGITGTSTNPQGHWRTLDKGIIRFSHGPTEGTPTYNSEDLTTRDIRLVGPTGGWGIEIYEYEDWTGVNPVGTGSVRQPWVLALAAGKFSWAIID